MVCMPNVFLAQIAGKWQQGKLFFIRETYVLNRVVKHKHV
jgi:hypothetical protein